MTLPPPFSFSTGFQLNRLEAANQGDRACHQGREAAAPQCRQEQGSFSEGVWGPSVVTAQDSHTGRRKRPEHPAQEGRTLRQVLERCVLTAQHCAAHSSPSVGSPRGRAGSHQGPAPAQPTHLLLLPLPLGPALLELLGFLLLGKAHGLLGEKVIEAFKATVLFWRKQRGGVTSSGRPRRQGRGGAPGPASCSASSPARARPGPLRRTLALPARVIADRAPQTQWAEAQPGAVSSAHGTPPSSSVRWGAGTITPPRPAGRPQEAVC